MSGEIEDLQMRMAFQEDMIANLSEQLAERDKDIKSLQTQVRELHNKWKELALDQDGHDVPPLERPPHY